MLTVLSEPLRKAQGFVAHMAGRDGDSWRVTEIWKSAEDASEFYAKYVDPNLPPGIKPKRRFMDLCNLIQA